MMRIQLKQSMQFLFFSVFVMLGTLFSNSLIHASGNSADDTTAPTCSESQVLFKAADATDGGTCVEKTECAAKFNDGGLTITEGAVNKCISTKTCTDKTGYEVKDAACVATDMDNESMETVTTADIAAKLTAQIEGVTTGAVDGDLGVEFTAVDADDTTKAPAKLEMMFTVDPKFFDAAMLKLSDETMYEGKSFDDAYDNKMVLKKVIAMLAEMGTDSTDGSGVNLFQKQLFGALADPDTTPYDDNDDTHKLFHYIWKMQMDEAAVTEKRDAQDTSDKKMTWVKKFAMMESKYSVTTDPIINTDGKLTFTLTYTTGAAAPMDSNNNVEPAELTVAEFQGVLKAVTANLNEAGLEDFKSGKDITDLANWDALKVSTDVSCIEPTDAETSDLHAGKFCIKATAYDKNKAIEPYGFAIYEIMVTPMIPHDSKLMGADGTTVDTAKKAAIKMAITKRLEAFAKNFRQQ